MMFKVTSKYHFWMQKVIPSVEISENYFSGYIKEKIKGAKQWQHGNTCYFWVFLYEAEKYNRKKECWLYVVKSPNVGHPKTKTKQILLLFKAVLFKMYTIKS